MKDLKSKLLGGIMGLCIGDALGVPVEFKSRSYLKKNPVDDMIGYGTYHQPPGTWSDDSSMTFCFMESLCTGYDLEDIGNKFVEWYQNSYWTPYNHVFDIGNATLNALEKIINGSSIHTSGNRSEMSNGNGSLMRILPLAFYLNKNKQFDFFKTVQEVSSITHAHLRSIIACQLYVLIGLGLINGEDKLEALDSAIHNIMTFYQHKDIDHELICFENILNKNVLTFQEKQVKSSGYVIDTLEAVLWTFYNTDTYVEAVLQAVNLGSDTDTIGAITGGLAGIYYGYDSLPADWLNIIARKDDIHHLIEKFYHAVS